MLLLLLDVGGGSRGGWCISYWAFRVLGFRVYQVTTHHPLPGIQHPIPTAMPTDLATGVSGHGTRPRKGGAGSRHAQVPVPRHCPLSSQPAVARLQITAARRTFSTAAAAATTAAAAVPVPPRPIRPSPPLTGGGGDNGGGVRSRLQVCGCGCAPFDAIHPTPAQRRLLRSHRTTSVVALASSRKSRPRNLENVSFPTGPFRMSGTPPPHARKQRACLVALPSRRVAALVTWCVVGVYGMGGSAEMPGLHGV
jgi:hypothetical protein